MQKKQVLFKTKGMNRDLSVSAFNPEFSFENINLRLATNDSNTTLSWVNEKGTSLISLVDKEGDPFTLSGVPIGLCTLNHYIVLFTVNETETNIYRLKYTDEDKTTLEVVNLYSSTNSTDSLNFDLEHPIETLVSYEGEDVQKVYWVDGKNQPRVINISPTLDNTKVPKYNASSFDFIPKLELNENIDIQKMNGTNGIFAPGVIQYAFTYYYKYGQESNIFYTSPLLYISHADRGASPKDRVGCSFKLNVSNIDGRFDFIRIYSIQRTSLNATPICKRVQDIEISSLPSVIPESVDNNRALSDAAPRILINGIWQYTNSFNADITISNGEWLGYFKSKHPDLVIKTEIETEIGETTKYISWGETSNTIWVSVSRRTAYGASDQFIISGDTNSQETPSSWNSNGELYQYDTPYTSLSVSFIDTGSIGDSIDPTELLYKGGFPITANTLEQKDNTLFLGNLTIQRHSLEEVKMNDISIKDILQKQQVGYTLNNDTRTFYPAKASSGNNYKYANQLSSTTDSLSRKNTVPCGGFKKGDYYRCGVQFQNDRGVWSEPVYLRDFQIENTPSSTDDSVTVPTIKGFINSVISTALINGGYKRARAVVVFPSEQDRRTLYQGVINPTLSYFGGQVSDYPNVLQSSWFFRPIFKPMEESDSVNLIANDGLAVAPYFEVADPLIYAPFTVRPIPSGSQVKYSPAYMKAVEIQGQFGINGSDLSNLFGNNYQYVTFHTPELEVSKDTPYPSLEGLSYSVVGYADIINTMSDIDIQTSSTTISNKAGGFLHKSFTKSGPFGIVAGLFYNDYIVQVNDNILRPYASDDSSYLWMVYPWQEEGSLNNDINRPSDKGVASAVLKKKVISNLRYGETHYFASDNVNTGIFTTNPEIYSSDEATIVKMDSKLYKGNVNTALVPKKPDGLYMRKLSDNDSSTDVTWKIDNNSADEFSNPGIYQWDGDSWDYIQGMETTYLELFQRKTSIRMKYKSAPHILLKHPSISGNFFFKVSSNHVPDNIWYLPILELNRELNLNTIFGGKTDDALKANIWIPCGEPVTIDAAGTTFKYEYGDTYYQRYDCLKTYAFTTEDINQIVEIGSFMLETRENIDGRYDRNRGQSSNLNMSPRNFNLYNPVYSQTDNFFTYRILDDDYYTHNHFTNQITWTKTKQNGAEVDLWTNITLASTLDLDGNLGSVTSLQRMNDQIICFQEKGISQILYNENTAISSTEGVPIEIANSGKVQGKRYISNRIGCINKWSICNTPSGIFFIEPHEKSIYLFNGELTAISTTGGMNTWCKNNNSIDKVWTPKYYAGFTSFYDTLNQEVLFTDSAISLAFSQKMNIFTSFYNYGGSYFFCNIDGTGVWVRGDGTIWKHQAGDYCNFFNNQRPYSLTLIGNPEPLTDKVFTNLEFRAMVNGDGNITNDVFTPMLPFESLEAWNEYQHGYTNLNNMVGHSIFTHHTPDMQSSLKRKFRIWRCDIPRNNCKLDSENINEPYSKDAVLGISRLYKKPLDRMRNPWLYLKLQKNRSNIKTEIHDIVLTYFN